ncbi:MAG: hypothetical protein A2X20_08735 [Bacteroidetes bacterium GWE2_40_15]|nr:MAG: hypothetical protein A2X20_08735 [Bacteroidetes bacterium GWE2_40_15]
MALPGAYVKLIYGKDTSNLSTDQLGMTRYRKEVKDSIGLTVSYLGFNTFSGKVKAAYLITVALSEKTYGITEVIIRGNMIAVISKGDTTRYNAAAFKTLVGDNMAELFKKFPGMEFNGTNLTFRGTTIERINIDDKRLFSNDVKLALENIRADDVISVDVYKESTDWDKLNNIENGRKMTVANVKTKSKPNRVFNKTVTLAGGQEIDKSSKERHEKKYEASGNTVFSQVGKTITANLSYQNTASNAQSKNLTGGFKFTRLVFNKLSFITDNVITNTRNYVENSSEQIYFPNNLYTTRSYLSDVISNDINSRFISKNSFSFAFRTKDEVSLGLNLDYSASKNNTSNNVLATLDGAQTNNMDLIGYRKGSSIKTSGNISYKKKFGSQIYGVTFSCGTNFSISEHDNKGSRVDTTTSSTSKLYLTDSGNGWERSYGTYINLLIPIKKNISMTVNNSIGYRDSKSERTAIDMLIGLVDTTNTHDYTFNYLKNELSFSVSFGSASNKSSGHQSTTIGVGWERQEQQRDEFFPKDYSIPRIYNIPTGRLTSTFKIKGYPIQTMLNLSSDPLPLEYLRNVIDDKDPTRLNVGNPNLKMPANLKIQFEGNIPLDKKGTSVTISVSGNNIRNYVTTKTEYFTEDTYLLQYNYNIAKGATLTTRENVSESWRLSSFTNLSMRLLGSNAVFSLGYDYEKTPSYVGEKLYNLIANRYSCGFSLNTAFSSVFDMGFKSFGGITRSFNGARRNDSFMGNVTVSPRIQLDNRTRLTLSGNYYHYENRQMPDTERNDFILNSSIYRRLDKKGNFTLSLQVNDILKQQSSIAINLGEDYTSTIRTLIPGRYWLVKAEFKF